MHEECPACGVGGYVHRPEKDDKPAYVECSNEECRVWYFGREAE